MSKTRPRISVVVPFHWMENWQFFLNRCLKSIELQSFKDYEVILTKAGSMPVNSNRAIQSAQGKIIKILYMDDYLLPDALQNLSDNFEGGWYASGCLHDSGTDMGNPHVPSFDPTSFANSIGSPSVVAFANDDPLLFDEVLSWMLDVDLYRRLYERYGFPTINLSMDVVIGLHKGQVTNLMSNSKKELEVTYVMEKYGPH